MHMGSLTYPAHSTDIQGHLFLASHSTLLSPFSNFSWCKGVVEIAITGSAVKCFTTVSCYTVFVFVRALSWCP